jgi:hypothetical protein
LGILIFKGGVCVTKRKSLVPEARNALNGFKAKVMADKGYHANNPDDIKFEVAKEQGIPLKKGYNGHLTSEQAGKVGGPIGGNMVKEMIRMAQEQLSKK